MLEDGLLLRCSLGTFDTGCNLWENGATSAGEGVVEFPHIPICQQCDRWEGALLDGEEAFGKNMAAPGPKGTLRW